MVGTVQMTSVKNKLYKISSKVSQVFYNLLEIISDLKFWISSIFNFDK